jgi:hypothetical protein
MEEAKDFEYSSFDIHEILSKHGIAKDEMIVLTNMVGRWTYHGRALQLSNFSGNYIKDLKGWLLIGECDSLSKFGTGRAIWSIDYNLANKQLTWKLNFGPRTHLFPDAFNNSEIQIRVDSSGNPTAIILNVDILNFLDQSSYLTFTH